MASFFPVERGTERARNGPRAILERSHRFRGQSIERSKRREWSGEEARVRSPALKTVVNGRPRYNWNFNLYCRNYSRTGNGFFTSEPCINRQERGSLVDTVTPSQQYPFSIVWWRIVSGHGEYPIVWVCVDSRSIITDRCLIIGSWLARGKCWCNRCSVEKWYIYCCISCKCIFFLFKVNIRTYRRSSF